MITNFVHSVKNNFISYVETLFSVSSGSRPIKAYLHWTILDGSHTLICFSIIVWDRFYKMRLIYYKPECIIGDTWVNLILQYFDIQIF